MKSLSALFLTMLIYSATSAYPIIKKEMHDCSRNNRCGHTSKELCTFNPPVGDPIVGYCIECSGAGSTKCPNSAFAIPGSDLDNVDVSNAENLFNYVDDKIENEEQLFGSHSINVFNTSDGTLRQYTVTWTFILNESEELTGTITIDKIIIPTIPE